MYLLYKCNVQLHGGHMDEKESVCTLVQNAYSF